MSVTDEKNENAHEFYNGPALEAYRKFMGDHWHHGDPDAENVGLSMLRSQQLLVERIVGLTGIQPGGKGIDFGSGIGGPTSHMAKVSGASFVGVTDVQLLNDVATERARGMGLKEEQVRFQTLPLKVGYKNLPFDDRMFDAATFFESVCHVADKATLFLELARVLKRGGRLAGTDWVQRPFGENQTEEQIMKYMAPVNEHIHIPWHARVEQYAEMMEKAGLKVIIARDIFPGIKCWGTTPKEQTSEWLNYQGSVPEKFREGKKALDNAREAGVFSVGMWVAVKP